MNAQNQRPQDTRKNEDLNRKGQDLKGTQSTQSASVGKDQQDIEGRRSDTSEYRGKQGQQQSGKQDQQGMDFDNGYQSKENSI